MKKEKRNRHWEIVISSRFRDDLRYWAETERRVLIKAFDIMEAVERDQFTGIGKPEPLKHQGAGIWSRRLTQEHRITYSINEGRIEFLQARYHY